MGRKTKVSFRILLLLCVVINGLATAVHIEEDKDEVPAVLFAGDISLDIPVRKGDSSSCAYEGILANLTEYFKSVDYNMVNLEAPFVTRHISKQTFLPTKGIHNMMWPEGIVALTSAGVKSVTLANNHITDFGGDALVYTEFILERNHIDYLGSTKGKKLPYTHQVPLIKKLRGIKIGFLNYCILAECEKYRPEVDKGPALFDKEIAKKDITELKAKVDVVVLLVHWGTEYMAIPGEEQRQLAVYLSDLGVKLIIGTHPHVMQGHEWIGETLVHYSLGNFVFHPHFTAMRKLQGLPKANRTAIHRRMMQQGKYSRGPAGFTELFKIEFNKTGVKEAYYLPIRIFIDHQNGCPYPRVRRREWLKVCGPKDDNCYAPRKKSSVL